jgi:uncharacterized membrane protein
MEFSGRLLGEVPLFILITSLTLVLAAAIRFASWQRLLDNSRSHAFLATIVVLMLLWSLRTDVTEGLQFHLLGATAVTLMFGWALAILATSAALIGISLTGLSDWTALPYSALTMVVVPVSLSYLNLLIVRRYLPKHFFVYVFVNAFVTGGLVATLCGFLSAFLLVAAGIHSLNELQENLMPFFPIMFFPEGVFNGWIITLLIVFRPEWVYSFLDREYLEGK